MLNEKEVFVSGRKIPEAHLRSICQYRKGMKTCKYIVFKEDAFYCVKKVAEMKADIDKLKDMKAKSDNCEGL